MSIETLDDFEFEEGIYTVDNVRYFVESNGDYHRIDTNINDDQSEEPETVENTVVLEQEEDHDSNNEDLTDSDLETNTSPPEVVEDEHAIKNKKEGECDLVEFTETEEGTEDTEAIEQFIETVETKPDGAFSMMERNIAECRRKSDYKRSREECEKEVKKIMAEKKMPIIETEDSEDKEPEKKEIEDEKEEKVDEKEEKKDTVEICPDELDMLREKAKKLADLEKDHKDLEKRQKSFEEDFLKIKEKIEAKEAEETEAIRQELITKISHDFQIPEEEGLNDETMEILEKVDRYIGLALRRDTDDSEEDDDDIDEDMTVDTIHKKYFCPV